MPVISHDDTALRELLENARVIAVVGYSNRPETVSYSIGRYLKRVGYKVYAVNPTISEIDGERVYPTLADVPEAIDIVNVFRRPEYLPEVFDQAIAAGAKAVWAQLGIHHEEAAQKAAAAGLQVVTDSCIKVEHVRLVRAQGVGAD
jgi:uncharacterized protein